MTIESVFNSFMHCSHFRILIKQYVLEINPNALMLRYKNKHDDKTVHMGFLYSLIVIEENMFLFLLKYISRWTQKCHDLRVQASIDLEQYICGWNLMEIHEFKYEFHWIKPLVIGINDVTSICYFWTVINRQLLKINLSKISFSSPPISF